MRSRRTRAVIPILLGVALLGAASCAPKRQPAPAVSSIGVKPVAEEPTPAEDAASPPEPIPSPPEPAPEVPADVEEEPASAAETFITEIRNRLAEADRLLADGRHEEARVECDAALSALQDSGFDFFEYPDVEDLYYEVLDRVQAAQRESMTDSLRSFAADASPPATDETAAFDDIASLELFEIEVDPKLRNRLSDDILQEKLDLPVVINDAVLRALDYFQGKGRHVMETGLKRYGRYRELFERVFRDNGLPQDLQFLVQVESLFNPRAYSRAHARGMWQFTAGTARLYGLRVDWWVDQRSSVEEATEAAAHYLKDLYDRYGDWYLVLAAYNSGPGRVDRILKRHGSIDFWEIARKRYVPRETRNFVPTVLASIIIFNNPEGFGFSVGADDAWQPDRIAVDEQVALSTVAELIDVPLEQLNDLNPELLRGITPFEMKGYPLKVPRGKAADAAKELAELPPEKRVRMSHHRVRKGETLGQIADRYGASLRAIAQVNRIRNVHRIRQGQDLMIPLAGWSSGKQPLPAAGRHIVSRGETLAGIARRYGVKLMQLLNWNGLSLSSIIYPGQAILLSAVGSGND